MVALMSAFRVAVPDALANPPNPLRNPLPNPLRNPLPDPLKNPLRNPLPRLLPDPLRNPLSHIVLCVFAQGKVVRSVKLAFSLEKQSTAQRELSMNIADTSPTLVQCTSKKRFGVDGYVLIVGLVAVAAFAIGRLVWEPNFAQKQQAMQTALTTEHMKVCDQLKKLSGTDRDNCMKLLDSLYTTHERAILADSSEI
jgi:hypothetical protein